jgi:nitrite reductase/ring-hydroxylating ferredoxin subunit
MANDHEGYQNVANTKDIQPSQIKAVQFDSESICVVNVEGKYYAINNVCNHEGGPLADGTLEGHEVECPWHGSKFDVRTGEVKNPPASEPESVYEVKVAGNSTLVRKQTPTTEQQQQQQQLPSRPSSEYNLTLIEKQKFEGTDVMSFKFSKQQQQNGREKENDEKRSLFYYTA